jgi:hypothetical protein
VTCSEDEARAVHEGFWAEDCEQVQSLMRQPTAYLPVAMSLGAVAMIVWFVAAHGVVHRPDEGAQAHLWQLLVAGQVPLIAYVALRWLPTAGRLALADLAR